MGKRHAERVEQFRAYVRDIEAGRLTQKQVAERLGVSKQAVSRRFNDYKQGPPLSPAQVTAVRQVRKVLRLTGFKHRRINKIATKLVRDLRAMAR